MVWFRVDDDLAFHPKVLAAGLPAMGLWIRAGAWSSQMLTDGTITPEMLTALGDPRQRHAQRLVDVRLWVPGPDGSFVFHEWDLRQPSRSTVRLTQEARVESGKEGSHIRWHVRRHVTDPECKWCNPSVDP
jgi:hypothetical protein